MKNILIVAAASVAALGLGATIVISQTNAPADTGATSPAPVAAKSPLPSGSTNEPTIITADHLHGDYAHNLGTFEGNVLVVDPRMTVRADKMVVFFGATNVLTTTGTTITTNTTRSVQKIIADGAVVMSTPDNKKANSEHAEYTAGDGKVVLTGGHPRAESADGIVTGDKITFWRDSQRMDVENFYSETNRPRLLIYPEEQRKQNEGGETK
ncbi:MAG TPA: LptA/OstA family protein [Verrucomicrobiae bacterium]|nr:LptA/OstA family protein [Verrucomicrobiae bacterium]